MPRPTRPTKTKDQLLCDYDELKRRDVVDLNKQLHSSWTVNDLQRNRYANIWPFNWTRVLLKTARNQDDYSQYINANHICIPKTFPDCQDVMAGPYDSVFTGKDYSQCWQYIATQGPIKNTVSDFWQMVYEQQSTVILMLARLEERPGVEACFQYWPLQVGDALDLEVHSATVDSIRIEFDQEISYPSAAVMNSEIMMIRDFIIIALKDNEIVEQRPVKQVQFLRWPDHGVPKLHDMTKLIQYMDDLLSTPAENNIDNDQPVYQMKNIVVHCSAGVGRTGTFISIYTMLLKMRNMTLAQLEVHDWQSEFYLLVKLLRTQRCFMVQTESQYLFCNDVLAHYHDQMLPT